VVDYERSLRNVFRLFEMVSLDMIELRRQELLLGQLATPAMELTE